MRKVLLFAVGVMFRENPTYQMAGTLSIMFASFIMQVKALPFLDSKEKARLMRQEAESKILQARQQIREEENEKVRKAQEKKKREEAEAQGFGRSITPEQAPVFDPEARFKSNTGGTGPAPGTGLAGAGGLDTDASDVIDPKSLFSMVV